jgi:hypothetical protein
MKWAGMTKESEYIVEIVDVAHASIVGYYSLIDPSGQEGEMTKITGFFPIVLIQKMEKIT